MSTVGIVGVAARGTGREVWWWLAGFGRLWRVMPRRVGLWTAGVATAAGLHAWMVLAVLVLLLVAPGLWARVGPRSWSRWVADPWRRRRIRRSVARRWPVLLDSCGLSRRVPGPDGKSAVQRPGLRSLSWSGGQLVAVPGLLVGQVVDDVHAVAERLRVGAGAVGIRVVELAAGTSCQLRWSFTDPLAAPFHAVIPDRAAPVSLGPAVMGRTDAGQRWLLPWRVSTLVGGASGAGKASAMWTLLAHLGPAVRAGLVELHGIDLKGGVELTMGRALFARMATTFPEAVVLLEDAAEAMRRHAAAIAGVVRSREPVPGDPLVVVVIDELAALTSYSTDRDLMRRADAALRLLLTQGRAPGYYVHAYVQDPRKETVPQRHLFLQAFGLRLREREEVTMVLTDGALAAGAACHKISRDTPGVGYCLAEDGQVQRVRVSYLDDDAVRTLAARFPSPVRRPITLPDDEDPVPSASGRKPRAPRGPRAPRTVADPAGGSEVAG